LLLIKNYLHPIASSLPASRMDSLISSMAEKLTMNDNRSIRGLVPIEVVVLQGYLSVKDPSYLDIAICGADLRSLLLNALQCAKI
jgi:hypothetical protein